jgi:IS1 family transposase/transposase-like protein
MTIQIILYCPDCQSTEVKKNGKKSCKKQNYLCKNCGRQFIGDHALSYKGCYSSLVQKILIMPVRGVGITDISVIENISIRKVLSVLANSNRIITPEQQHYDNLEVDEFWTYVGCKKNRVWLIYAYHRSTGEIVAYVWGKRNYKTIRKLRDKLLSMKVSFDVVHTDNWDSFIAAFQEDNHIVGKENTKGIEGNNCCLRHRIRRAYRKPAAFQRNCLIT